VDAPTLRTAGSLDVPGLLAMIAGLHAEESIPWKPAGVEAALRRLLAEPALGSVILMEWQGRPAGYAIVTLGFDLEFHGCDAYLTDLWVEPWARGWGHSRPLLDAAEAAARAAGARALHLTVRPENGPAVALYAGAGFDPAPRRFLTKVLA
jgi:ribosomal protein S18 acetylase RimI-like enzyme